MALPNLINDVPDSFIENLLVEENKRLRAQVTALRDQLAESQAHIDALQSIIKSEIDD